LFKESCQLEKGVILRDELNSNLPKIKESISKIIKEIDYMMDLVLGEDTAENCGMWSFKRNMLFQLNELIILHEIENFKIVEDDFLLWTTEPFDNSPIEWADMPSD